MATRTDKANLSEGMDAKMLRTPAPFTRRLAPSPAIRLAQLYGVSRPKTALALYTLSCQRVAQGNRVYREYGLPNVVTDHMAAIDASLASELPALTDAINSHNTADAQEDVAQADYVRRSGDDELEAWIKRLARDLRNGEVLLACLEAEKQWRRENQEARV